MIKLFSNHCMVVDAQGKAETYDFDALRNVLQVCFERHSVREFWLTEHVSLVVEEQMLQRRAEGAELPPESLIDEQVALVLRASGYAEVAADYERERGLAPPEIPSIELLPWNRKRLEKRLGADLPLSSAQVQALAREVGTAIEKLGMKNVGDELIRQVAIHVLQLGTDHSGPVSTRKNDWLFGVADLRPLFDSAGSRLAQLSI
ncbi:MAG: hypothetical protein KAI66_11160 [Lentisphaeria bacterium]|nr:hypothetical protein [Lentisphaeria bacterium]